MKGLILFLLVLLLLIIGVVVGSQNDQMVTVNYLVAQASMRLSTLMAIVLSMGVALGLLTMASSWLALRVKLGVLRQKLKKLQSE
ncbi:lipopolysaccharide assembly protein LapA domain-containing protein [Alteromonas oceanisediminis]|uniref:lipopolysaccharide assembly protein LapA domain-containing protein n=1 Tax=Alteromonas oceanisediminis TaxID=2836180 RepID=UPI001BDB4091|nr:LapA family protein [Alteromonas oceanisediminis]MBT0586351.1 DUF1049 domain-containing protein [Alteromonas oceanisediminis]